MIFNGANIYLSASYVLVGLEYNRKEEKYNNCTELEGNILSLMNEKSMSLDEIKFVAGLDDEKIEELLFEMEIRGYIKQVSGMFTLVV